MIVNKQKGRRVAVKESKNLTGLVWFTLLLFLGIGLGIGLSYTFDQTTGAELTQYLNGYVSLSQTMTPQLIFTMTKLYFTPVLVAFCLGFVSIGVVLLPIWTVLYGATLSFCVSVLVATFGQSGLWVAMALLSIRCLVSLPCYLWVALQAHSGARSLAQVCLGVKKGTSLGYDGACYWGFAMWGIVLLLGVCIDCWLSPRLLSWALVTLI